MEMAAGVIAFIRDKGVSIPQEISIVSFDDPLWARYMDPPLTVVSQPMETMGKRTMELLLGRLRGGTAAQTLVFSPELMIRTSTGPPVGRRSSSVQFSSVPQAERLTPKKLPG